MRKGKQLGTKRGDEAAKGAPEPAAAREAAEPKAPEPATLTRREKRKQSQVAAGQEAGKPAAEETPGKPAAGQSAGEAAAAQGAAGKPAAAEAAGKPPAATENAGQPGQRPAKPVDDATKAKLAKEARGEILAGIAQLETDGEEKTFIPPKWRKKYKPVLGPYTRFLRAYPETFALVYLDDQRFLVKRADDPSVPAVVQAATWGNCLNQAWRIYCDQRPKGKRSFQEFISTAVPEGIRRTEPGEPRPHRRDVRGGRKEPPKDAPATKEESGPPTKQRKSA